MSSKKSRLGYIPLLGIAIALGFGGHYLFRQVIGKQLTPLDAAEIIPDEATIAGFIETDSQEWSQIKQLGNSQTKKIIETQIENFQAELDSESKNFNYEQDIEPWLGGAMFTLLPENSDIAKPNLLLVLGIKNKLKARDFLKKVQAESQVEVKKTKYKEVKITESTGKNNSVTAFALLGNKLLLAEESQVIERAIDTYKGEPSLASTEQNEQMLKQKMTTGDALAQFYIPKYGELITQALKSSDFPSMPANLAALESIDSTVINFGAERQGLRLQSVTKFGSDKFEQNFSPNKGELLQSFPEQTMAIVNGQGIDRFWTEVLTYLKQDQAISANLNSAKSSLQQMAGLNLEEDIFNWMNGEFALGIVATQKSLVPEQNINLSGGIILETSQPKQAKNTLAKLNNTLEKYLSFTSTENKVNQKTVTQLRAYGAEDSLNYGWLDNNKLLIAWGDSAFELIGESKKSSLANNQNFKATTQRASNSTLGSLYINVPQIMSMVNQFPIPESNQAQNAIAVLNSVKGVGSTVTMTDKRTSQQDLFILFKDD